MKSGHSRRLAAPLGRIERLLLALLSRGRVVAGVVLLALAFSEPVHAAPVETDEKRVALVVGNAAYRHTAALANPRHDAEDVAATLRGAGFEVVEGLDLDKAGMDETLARFARLAADADAALIFYAGHGMQYEGRNYLIPVDAELKDEIGIQFETTPLDDVMNAFVRVNGIRILILDACRNNPLAGRLAQNQVLVGNGFSRISSPRGMLVASATQANELAFDGTARNSVFTSALVAEMRVPGLEVHELFRRVAVHVSEETEGKQLPETSSSLAGSFYLKPGQTGEDAWLRVRESADVEDLRRFIERFPSSLLVDAARARIELIERSAHENELRRRLAASEEALRSAGLLARVEEPPPVARVPPEPAEPELQVALASPPSAAAKADAASAPTIEPATTAAPDRLPPPPSLAQAEPPPAAEAAAAEPAGEEQVAVVVPPPVEREPSAAEEQAPRPEPRLRQVQERLKRLGCYAGRADGLLGEETRAALARFADAAGIAVPATLDTISDELLFRLESAEARNCVLTQDPIPVPAQAPALSGNGPPAPASCAQILERAQLGELSARDAELLAELCN